MILENISLPKELLYSGIVCPVQWCQVNQSMYLKVDLTSTGMIQIANMIGLPNVNNWKKISTSFNTTVQAAILLTDFEMQTYTGL